ncbi:MAG: hypothetical protein O3A00_22470 [Planctomycetota bacterium]|nr:hypothetical protein [Planctomycetota bacterium]
MVKLDTTGISASVVVSWLAVLGVMTRKRPGKEAVPEALPPAAHSQNSTTLGPLG